MKGLLVAVRSEPVVATALLLSANPFGVAVEACHATARRRYKKRFGRVHTHEYLIPPLNA